jgi:Ni,Fe-hydrogenase maturation factor
MKEQKTNATVLLVAMGNREHGDNGLGWMFVDMIESLGYDFLNLEYREQMFVEDAKLIGNYDVVIFVDASYQKFGGGFEISRCFAASHGFYFSNAQAPPAMLYLAKKLYQKTPKAYLLSISGEEWEEQPSLSSEAIKNVQSAVEFFDEQFLPSILGVRA